MRLHSTPESALNLEITKLAILESIVSVAVYISAAVYLGTFKYLAAAIVAAPLMLFRTEMSAVWALNLYEKYFDKLNQNRIGPANWSDLLYSFLTLMVIAPVLGFAIRILSTPYGLIRAPLRTLSEVPQNWQRQCLCTDFFHVPEVVPLEAVKGEQRVLTFRVVVQSILKEESTVWRVVFLVICSPLLLIGYLPPLIYRVSFKATAVAYLPFIWVAHATLRNPMAADVRLERITKGELEKVRRVFSWGIFVTLLAKFGFVLGLVDWSRIEEKFPSKRLVESLVVPTSWPWWQITLLTDALLTFFLFFFADAALARLKTQQAWNDGKVLGTVSTVSFLRASLGLLTISHFFYIALLAVAPAPLHRLLGG